MMRKLLGTALVAIVMGTANPVHAQSGQIIYMYVYEENGQEVGNAFDICHPHGQIIERQLFWGYATLDFYVIPLHICRDGQLEPIT